MGERDGSFMDKRKYERKPMQMPATYILNDIECPCHIIDISSQGIGMRVRGCLETGDLVKIILGNMKLNAKVVRVDGNIVGVMFELLTDEQLNGILALRNI